MPEADKPNTNARPGFHAAQWVIAVALAFIAGALWARDDSPNPRLALAQNAPLAGARGVYALAGQLDRDTYGLFMLDIEQGTMWCYQLESADGVQKLRLVAGRSWLYDRYLRDFNCLPPSYREVQDLVALQRKPRTDRDAAQRDDTATPGGSSKPE